MTALMTSDMPGTTQEAYERLAAALLAELKASNGFIAHAGRPGRGRLPGDRAVGVRGRPLCLVFVVPSMPPGATPPSITFRPIAKIVTRD